MSGIFHITPRAGEDLISIGRYTLKKWNRVQRDKYLREIDRRFQWLANKPELGKHRREIEEGYYSFPQGSHVIFYIILEDRIDIIGIPHKNMDILNYFDAE
ncbi:MAG: type II toxin-antitoxin system RelE/ParE family toxin [Devosiaceae bacterium]|nr:type II toxin-antitoxin system RelE/ParE family toxin [Devosiaceae bacterium]